MLHESTDGVEIVDERTVRFHFKAPFLDFPMPARHRPMSAAPAGWCRRNITRRSARTGSSQKPIGAGPYKLVSQEPGVRLDFEAFEGYYRPVHVKQFTMVSVPEAATRIAMLERGEADIIYNRPRRTDRRGSRATRS